MSKRKRQEICKTQRKMRPLAYLARDIFPKISPAYKLIKQSMFDQWWTCRSVLAQIPRDIERYPLAKKRQQIYDIINSEEDLSEKKFVLLESTTLNYVHTLLELGAKSENICVPSVDENVLQLIKHMKNPVRRVSGEMASVFGETFDYYICDFCQTWWGREKKSEFMSPRETFINLLECRKKGEAIIFINVCRRDRRGFKVSDVKKDIINLIEKNKSIVVNFKTKSYGNMMTTFKFKIYF